MEALNEKQYSSEQAKLWSSEIGDLIKARLKGTYDLASLPGTLLFPATQDFRTRLLCNGKIAGLVYTSQSCCDMYFLFSVLGSLSTFDPGIVHV